ncbi:MAG: Uncharacterized protein G01um101418_309 [Parcubacteria group bacterium Gr01-1014_18]|nr:MAG: Uncharacterized protein Greene041636_315 [Parcubacteria group bacterium Greene0416_36]TSC81169.1 MAG: Uncharacterized protein G01um101418_309 [Parcubacteria group bacterium Gr01-1014_18]TSC99166.1 MAG: Uncharacterized protein Greene101420_311 [Parcubacteria group bacterium Greene1014_20]TSD07476.1 MAG: Uncharacterized protein Greene07142_175 [Parcubacteria group bacterium Greene0714_2]
MPFARLLPLFLILALLVTTGIGCKGGSEEAKQAFTPVTLKYWRVFEDEDMLTDAFAAYKQMHPNISVEYKKFRFEEYRDELLNAFAEDRGPDMFTLHNTWVGEYIPKLATAPETTTLPIPVMRGTIKKEQVIELQTSRGITVPHILNNFVDQVAYDVIWEDRTTGAQKIFGAPLGFDTLVMFYNKDILNNAGIPTPPATWSEFQQAVKKIVRVDDSGRIILSGAALGTASNVERSSDILSLLMMQNGAVMETLDRDIKFHEMPQELAEKRVIAPGEEAVRFYTDFSSPVKEVYTWTPDMPNSLDAFISGRLAFFFGYSYHIPVVKQRAPKLNYAIGKVPQIPGNPEVNFANYFVEVVSKKSRFQNEAWDLLKFISSADAAKGYLAKAKKPTALRSLVLSQIEDVEMGPFAEQILTAKSWYKGYEPLAVESIFRDMIDQANKGEYKLKDIIGNAADKVEQTTVSRIVE